ncbi:GC-rich sequence DNA-binding factor [Kwoniella heveanensis BCC8398]|uniref:GC-rich sequence DNA-binding factor n=1 Tax=Kwoniella heveanensis BCC8398 TaxID=1296120 RepID=A0A1B9H1B4_9TREE|nr:GC-rich sequence DNA-binding factor [Kwoniella heveanensis BCC8398]
MFIKRAKSRPSIRSRDSGLPEGSSSTGSPLAKSSVTASAAAADDANTSVSMDVDPDESMGSIMERKKAQKKDRKSGLGGSSKSKGTRLSFGGEEEEAGSSTPFKPKKSLLSQQIKLPETPASGSGNSAASVPSSSSSASGMYSKEYLTQLKASTPTRAPRTTEIEDEEDEEAMGPDGLSSIARNKYASSIVEDTTAGIPDATAIAAAKAKRHAALESQKHGGGEEDYISLGAGKIAVYDGDQGPHPESRLMREEDDLGDGDEDLAAFTTDNDKVYLGREANKAAARRIRGEMGELIADREEEDDDDEETKEWERAQAQRAGRWEDEKPKTAVKKGYKPAPIPTARPIPTISSAQSRLAKSLADFSITKTENERNLETTARELASLEKEERELREEVEKVEGKREWVEGFRGWVELLGKFLEEKFPKLEAIEADALHHYEERAKMTVQRRSADDSDDLSLFIGVPAPTEDPSQTDEFGRSTADQEAGPSSIRRKIRRDERVARRGKRSAEVARAVAEEEGFSTDSSLAEGDAEDYATAQNNLERRVHALLDDVKAEDFRDPEKGIAVRFGGWRQKYEEEYTNAFGGLALVQAWEFWARGEMVGWEPLRSSKTLDSFPWFHSLHHYSRPPLPRSSEPEEDDMDLDEEPPLGPDGDLVASMVSSAVVPLLTKAFEAGAYDPYSAPQTRRAVDLADVVAELTGKDSRKHTALLKAILGVYHSHLLELSGTISASTAPNAIPPPAFDPASRPAMERFVRRRIKLLKNMTLWRREAPQEIRELVIRLVGEVLRPALGRTWEGGGKEMAAKVLAVSTGLLSPDLVGFLQQGPSSRW